jgi:starch synthase (maltosyl-transferring)
LQQLRDLTFHEIDSPSMLAWSKTAPDPAGGLDRVITVVNLDPFATHEATLTLDLPALGLHPDERFVVADAFTGSTWVWGQSNYVRLDPFAEPAHVLTVHRSAEVGGGNG